MSKHTANEASEPGHGPASQPAAYQLKQRTHKIKLMSPMDAGEGEVKVETTIWVQSDLYLRRAAHNRATGLHIMANELPKALTERRSSGSLRARSSCVPSA
mmetsp:Transcript_18452/g.28784  ORF Transcript_18452/g.28784 Transcript_18452/m.28784 type:complete len:101 (-) Transcript_18452:263-565(-)|eukprot:CAMPEP_0184311710 /NCGR_PEP_ID=MMETSP1049-20130417/44322_1 /TAXON_ID=77928 /ORGANISM="Proteomonas sulcata, Strain CCMP704" /LENGTH=100 /DNA_ID=CAMNT_0026627309 /DNA_START=277 /DNA_END=579 /DNA_ORIENTATION=-